MTTNSRLAVVDGIDDASLSADPLAAAQTVRAVAVEHADQGEHQRFLAQPVIDAFVASGLAGLMGPTALGGLAARPATLVDVVATIAAGDPSAGWCAGIGIGANHFAGYVPHDGARELFTDLSRPASGAFAPTARGFNVSGGYRVSGRWPFASGCKHASLQASGLIVFDENGDPRIGTDGSPLHRLAFIPSTALSILDTWDTVGLRGTGSHDTAVKDLVVPHEHTITFGDRPWADDAVYRMPLFTVLAPCLASAALGIGRAALDAVELQARTDFAAPPRPGPRPRFADDPFGQSELGQAEVRWRAARSLLMELLDGAYETVAAGAEVARVDVALIGLTSGEAMAASAHAVDVACRISGSAAVREGAPLERARRDIDTMRKHVLFSPGVQQPLGRQAAGVPTVAYPFLLPPV
jgi:alkylation response protein AidB-like acyl-CoA dehydrogenase